MLKFYMVVAFLLIGIAIGGYYYLNKMKTYHGGLNINKVEEIDTFYTRSFYGDYYFRVIDYDQDKSIIKSFINEKIYPFFDEGTVFVNGYYSEMIPFKVAMGYDLSMFPKARFTLQNFDLPIKGDLITEVGKVADENNAYIDQVKNFKEVFAKILATQDQDFFTLSMNDTQEMLREFYPDINHSIKLEKIDKNSFYETVDTTINNLAIKYFKLNYFKLSQALTKKEWNPNIARWTYGDTDITLQYRRKETNVLLRNLRELVKSNNDEIVVNTISINDSKVIPRYFKIDTKKHTITSYHMSKDGYLYILKMRADSKRTLITTMHDFMKIAMGICFDETPTDKWFVKHQKEAIKNYDLIMQDELADNLSVLDDNWAVQMLNFKKEYGQYPSKKEYEELKEAKEKESVKNKVKRFFL